MDALGQTRRSMKLALPRTLSDPVSLVDISASAGADATELAACKLPLRALWQHPPYFHDGNSAPDLVAVVNHYNSVFQLGLRDKHKADLVEYLKTL